MINRLNFSTLARFSKKIFEPQSSNKKRETRSWRRPTFPLSSIIGAARLNFCVRDGNRCGPCARITRTLSPFIGTKLTNIDIRNEVMQY